jgi:hypothetical protein
MPARKPRSDEPSPEEMAALRVVDHLATTYTAPILGTALHTRLVTNGRRDLADRLLILLVEVKRAEGS